MRCTPHFTELSVECFCLARGIGMEAKLKGGKTQTQGMWSSVLTEKTYAPGVTWGDFWGLQKPWGAQRGPANFCHLPGVCMRAVF